MTATELKDLFLSAGSNDVNNSAVVLFLGKTFQDQIVAHWLLVLHEVVGSSTCLEHQWVRIFADFTLKRLPEEGLEIRARLCLTLYFEPAAQALKVDKADRASTFA